MSTQLAISDEFIAKLREEIQSAILTSLDKHIINEATLWTIQDVADYFKRTKGHTYAHIINRPSFPKAMRSTKKADPLWFAQEIVDWAKKQKDK